MSIYEAFLAWWTVDRVNASANVGLLLTAIVTAVLALKSMQQARDIERRANRPMMIAEIIPPDRVDGEVSFRVANMGRSVAKNVTLEFDPPLPEPDLERLNEQSSSTYNFTNIARLNVIFVDRTFLTWTPGMEVTAMYWAVPKDFDPMSSVGDSAEGVPPEQGVILRFDDEAGESYVDKFTLDVHTVLGVTFVDSEEKRLRQLMQKLVRQNESNMKAIWQVAHNLRYSREELAEQDRQKLEKIRRIQQRESSESRPERNT